MGLLTPNAMADVYRFGLNTIAPGNAYVTETAGGFTVRPDKQQTAFLKALIERKISSRPKGAGPVSQEKKVRLDLSSVYMPIVYKRAIPVAAGLVLAGYLLGRFLK